MLHPVKSIVVRDTRVVKKSVSVIGASVRTKVFKFVSVLKASVFVKALHPVSSSLVKYVGKDVISVRASHPDRVNDVMVVPLSLIFRVLSLSSFEKVMSLVVSAMHPFISIFFKSAASSMVISVRLVKPSNSILVVPFLNVMLVNSRISELSVVNSQVPALDNPENIPFLKTVYL